MTNNLPPNLIEKLRNYKSNLDSVGSVSSWLNALQPATAKNKRVLITALRNKSWIEWAAYSACVLHQMGYSTTLIHRVTEIGRIYKNTAFWKKIGLVPDIEFVNLDEFRADELTLFEFNQKIPDTIIDAVAYDHHIERVDVVENMDKYRSDIDHLVEESAKSVSMFKSSIFEQKFHRFICYSGLIGITPTLLAGAIDKKIETYCLEGWAWRAGHIIYNKNMPALEYNIQKWMAHYGWNSESETTINEYLDFQDGKSPKKSNWLTGFYNIQKTDKSAPFNPALQKFIDQYPKSFLLAPNVIGDSSTLNRETIFSGIRVWIKEVIEYFIANPQQSLIIRAHPAEAWVKSKIKIQLGEFAEKLAAGHPNIFILKGSDKTNTFSLLPHTKCGLVWMSSVGVDLVLRNIPTICAASPKYSGLGIVEEPATKPGYFKLLDEFAQRDVAQTTDEQKLSAKKYLYVVFKGFSYPAHGKDFMGKTLKLNNMPHQAEHDDFYKIIVGELTAPDA